MKFKKKQFFGLVFFILAVCIFLAVNWPEESTLKPLTKNQAYYKCLSKAKDCSEVLCCIINPTF